jgi:hypothetical protein
MTAERRRWDVDERFVGVADAGFVTEEIRRLLEATSSPAWVTEDAEAHIGVHLKQVCDEPTSPWHWISGRQDTHGVLVVELEHITTGEWDSWRDAVALLGQVAESSFFVRRLEHGTYACVTGMLDGDGEFATHGHTVLLHVRETGSDR